MGCSGGAEVSEGKRKRRRQPRVVLCPECGALNLPSKNRCLWCEMAEKAVAEEKGRTCTTS